MRPSRTFDEKLKVFNELGFDAVQFHDDDAVPELDNLSMQEIRTRAQEMCRKLEDHDLVAEFTAPCLWEHSNTIDGAFTSSDPKARIYAIERSKKTADIGRELGTNQMVLWLAREGTYMRMAKDATRATNQLIEAVNALLEYDKELRVAIEPNLMNRWI